MKASVKIMLSYDYSHFEIALSRDEDLDIAGVNELRKTAQRLADEAVRQYKKAKEMAEKRLNSKYERSAFLREIEEIQKRPAQECSVRELAMMREYSDGKWEERFNHAYDYDDDYDDGGDEDFEEEA